MNEKLWKIVKVGVPVVSALVSIAAAAVSDKKLDETVTKKVNEALASKANEGL